jgi:hypothetical protein
VVVVVVAAGTVEPTKELARPVPTIATEVTTTVGRTRRRTRDRLSDRALRARLAARRWPAASSSSGISAS